MHTYTCIRGIDTAAEYPKNFHFFVMEKPNSETEGIAVWLQIVAFWNTSCNLIGEYHEFSCCENPKSYFTWLSEIYEHIMTMTLTPSVLSETSEVQFTQTPAWSRSIAEIRYHRQGGGWRQNWVKSCPLMFVISSSNDTFDVTTSLVSVRLGVWTEKSDVTA